MVSILINIIQHEQYYWIISIIGLKAASLLKKKWFPVSFANFLWTAFFYRTHSGDCFWIKFCKS